jgi:fatty acid desaturase
MVKAVAAAVAAAHSKHYFRRFKLWELEELVLKAATAAVVPLGAGLAVTPEVAVVVWAVTVLTVTTTVEEPVELVFN